MKVTAAVINRNTTRAREAGVMTSDRSSITTGFPNNTGLPAMMTGRFNGRRHRPTASSADTPAASSAETDSSLRKR